MIEYCQVQWRDDKVVATNGTELLVSGNNLINIFNKLGKDNWKMCGQAIASSYILENDEKHYSTIFYFIREVKE